MVSTEKTKTSRPITTTAQRQDHGPDEEGADLRSQQLSHPGATAQQEHQEEEHNGHHHQLPDRHSDGVGEAVGHKV